MLTQDTEDVVRTLEQLLQTAQTPDKDGGPVVICEQHELFPSSFGRICIVKSDQRFAKNQEGGETIGADEYINGQLALGFKLMWMGIVRELNAFGDKSKHVVMTVLVKSKNN